MWQMWNCLVMRPINNTVICFSLAHLWPSCYETLSLLMRMWMQLWRSEMRYWSNYFPRGQAASIQGSDQVQYRRLPRYGTKGDNFHSSSGRIVGDAGIAGGSHDSRGCQGESIADIAFVRRQQRGYGHSWAQDQVTCVGFDHSGSYSQSTGVEVIRQDCASFISKRDGIPSKSQDIFITNGASEAIKAVLQIMATQQQGKERAGIMVPIPQYPLYSATNAEYNAYQVILC